MLTWKNTKSWVLTLTVAGGGWRLPTQSEFQSLYSSGILMIAESSYGTSKISRAYIDPIFALKANACWGIDPGNSPAVEYILYSFGSHGIDPESVWFSPGSPDEVPFPAFAVRKQMKNN